MAEKGKVKDFLKNVFGNPEDEDDIDEYQSPRRDETSSYDTLYGDKFRPVQELNDGFGDYDYKEESSMHMTNMKDDMAAFASSEINIEQITPNFEFVEDLSLELITDVTKEVLDALRNNKIVMLDLYDLGDDERTVMTYVVLGAVNVLGYTMTNVRDHMMFTLTPEGIGVEQDDRVKLEDEEDSKNLTYSNDFR